ncbi:MAG: methyltransferase [Acholeplasmatales bacterium]|nr:methyltransferase [Acholeplasmatales bacterium]
MIKIYELLGVKGIPIYQDRDLYTFTLDSVLLANFADVKEYGEEILDLGTGVAPIPLYLTLKTKSHITGIEIQDVLYDLSKKSVKMNVKEEQISLINDDMKNLENYFKPHSFTHVLSNPPFFKTKNDSHVNPNEVKAIARHEIKITLDELVKTAADNLRPLGHFSIVYRPERAGDLLNAMYKHNIIPKRMRFVYDTEKSDTAVHVLVDGVYNGKQGGLKVLRPLYIHPSESCHKDEILNIYNGVIIKE